MLYIERLQKENLVTKNVTEGLRTISPQMPRLHIQPKIHTQGNPGRPVFSSVNCQTSNISKHFHNILDFSEHLQTGFSKIIVFFLS